MPQKQHQGLVHYQGEIRQVKLMKNILFSDYYCVAPYKM